MTTNISRLFVGMGLTLGLVLSLILALPGTASAVPAAEADRLTFPTVGAAQNPTANLVFAGTFSFSQYGTVPQAGTSLRLTVTSCGQYVQAKVYTFDGASNGTYVGFSPSGALDASPNWVNRKIGPSFEWTAEVTQPGYDTYVYTGSYNGYTVRRPSCSAILNGEVTDPGNKLVVKKWSKKVSLARTGTRPFVGKKMRITKTVSNGKEQYTWLLNGKVIKKGRAVFVKPAYKGKVLKAQIIAYRGNEGKSKTLKFGKVRR